VDSTTHYETHTSRHLLQHILPNIPDKQWHHRFMAAPCAELWTVENTWDWMDKTPSSTHDLSVWSSSSLGRRHPRSSVLLLVLTRHSSPILNERWTCVINLSMFFYYVMIFLLFWGHEPCIGFFVLRRFNMPDALICYPGSIEKLKLLGATYLLKYSNLLPFCTNVWLLFVSVMEAS
jgi:hypothetical protein